MISSGTGELSNTFTNALALETFTRVIPRVRAHKCAKTKMQNKMRCIIPSIRTKKQQKNGMTDGTTSCCFVEVDITPPFPVELIGGSLADPVAHEALDALRAQACVFETARADGTRTRTALVSVDSVGFTVALAAALRARVAAAAGCPGAHAVMLCFTHTHAAPDPRPPARNGARYFALVGDALTSALQSALAPGGLGLRPCRAAWRCGACAGLGTNRRALVGADPAAVDGRRARRGRARDGPRERAPARRRGRGARLRGLGRPRARPRRRRARAARRRARRPGRRGQRLPARRRPHPRRNTL